LLAIRIGIQAEYDNGVSEDGINHANKRLETYDKAAGKLYERIPQSEASRKYAALQLAADAEPLRQPIDGRRDPAARALYDQPDDGVY
jgi:hypothetical protein